MNFYGVDYFLQRFGQIPEKDWCRSYLTDSEGRHCALGHLGVAAYCEGFQNEEACALIHLCRKEYGMKFGMNVVYAISDGLWDGAVRGRPKYSMLRFLRRIKRKERSERKPHFKRREVVA